MHEMAIALNIIEIAESEAIKANAERINQLELEIGTLSGIEIEALQFALETAKEKTMLNDTSIHFNIIQAEGICEDCGAKINVNNIWINCPNCKSYNLNIINGKELKVKSLNVD